MPTALENAKAAEQRRLQRSGLDANGKPLKKDDDRGGGSNDDETDEEREEREAQEAEAARLAALGDGGDEDDNGGNRITAEIQTLRQQLAALEGRVGPAQRDAVSFKGLWETEREARARETRELNDRIAALTQQIEEREQLDPSTLLTEDEKKDIDPLVLSAITKIAGAIAKRAQPAKVDVKGATLAVLKEREEQRVKDYRAQVMSDPTKGLHKLAQLAYDPKFIAWSRQGDNDVDSVVTSLLNATSTEEVDRYAKLVGRRIAAFAESSKGKQQIDPKGSLSSHMRREAKPKRTAEEEKALLAKAKNLARSSRPADREEAQRILNDLDK